MSAPTVPTLDRAAFRAWLATKKPRESIGRPRSPWTCPIAIFYAHLGVSTEVSAGVITFRDTYDAVRTPDWARHFIDAIDHGWSDVTIRAVHALRILDSIPDEVAA